MTINIPKYKYLEKEQTIDFSNNNICTLIGKNGSGKSTLLESIFYNYIEIENQLRENNSEELTDNMLNETLRCISFSSGQNELFSTIFNNYDKNAKRYERENNIAMRSFYFDYNWSRLLIFFATSLTPNGLVRKYLVDNNYIKVKENKDISSYIQFPFRVRQPIINKILAEHEQEEQGKFKDKSSIRSLYIEFLNKIIKNKIDQDFDFRDKDSIYRIVSRSLYLESKNIKYILGNEINKIFTFFSRASTTWLSNFDLKDISLYFNEDLEFEQLSDGEYQLLSIYSLIDLFDDENTIFLLDEVDSHLYYKNIHTLWDTLKSINGKIITTTHSYESIIVNDFDSINYIENGNIVNYEKDIELFKKLSNVTNHNNYGFKITSQKENIVLIDDLVDWIIFKKLLVKKLGEEVLKVINKITPYKKTSDYDSPTKVFGRAKLEFVKNISELDFDIKTKNFFLICDRDNLDENLIRNTLEVNIDSEFNSIKKFNSNNTKTHLLSWKRLEIENYLISKTMLNKLNLLENFKEKLNHLNFDTIECFDTISDIKKMDCKYITHPLYKENGFDENALDNLIDTIPKEEISQDIENMYNFIKAKIG